MSQKYAVDQIIYCGNNLCHHSGQGIFPQQGTDIPGAKFFGGINHKQNKEERKLGVSNEELIYGKKPMVVTEVPEEFVNELKAEKEESK